MTPLHFRGLMKILDGNPYILVSAARVKKLKPNWRKSLPVLVQINGKPDKPWHINMMPVGTGAFYLYLHGDVRKASKTKVGDTVTVDLQFDSDYRNGPQHPMPVWFKGPLSKYAKAKKGWEKLIPSRQKEILRYFSCLRSDAARTRNVQKALRVLSGKKERFMARDWNV